MELFERETYLNKLTAHYQQVENGAGHTIFLTGEAGIGKTSVVNYFIRQIESKATVYTGACDSLFTPRPLGPLFDIAVQIGMDFMDLLRKEKDRSLIFATLIQRLSASEKPVVLVFEDIHWTDEATLDLIRFLARRINRFRCLFLLTYRDDEIHSRHPLSTVFGELPSDLFSKITINRFSREGVDRLAVERGYVSGKQLFELTGGNPFYVMEILANDNHQIPERVKDSILSVFKSKADATGALLECLSILPSRIEFALAKLIEEDFPNEMEACIASGIIVSMSEYLSFKHELYRLTIEESLSPSRRRNLNKKVLDIMLKYPDDFRNLSRLVHHARYAEEKALVAEIAPLAAQEAAIVGAHIEAAKLYLTAIEHTDKKDPALVELYERHAYECYLIYQPATAIVSQEQALEIWRQRNISLKEGDSLRFLSRLWWLAGNQKNAMVFALQSIKVLENGFPTPERAMAYSNLSQLYMLEDNPDQALFWGNKAFNLAAKMDDKSIVCHALLNVGTVLLQNPATQDEGEAKLNETLEIARDNSFHEHAARAYGNLSISFACQHQYEKAMPVFELGIKYCEERDLGQFSYYMQSHKVRALFETGRWEEAESLAVSLQASLNRPGIINIDATASLAKLNIRRGNFDEARRLILDAKSRAMPTREAQRIVPVLTAELELAWMGESVVPLEEIREAEETLFHDKNNSWYYSELAYWMIKCGILDLGSSIVEFTGTYKIEFAGNWESAAESWKKNGRAFEQALALFESNEDHQKQALLILDNLGASATYEKLKSKLVSKGVRNIPRGPQESTRNNPAQLTSRQIEILILLEEGLQNKEIADKLFISPKTVDNHMSAIFSQLEVNSRAKAVLAARKLGILKK